MLVSLSSFVGLVSIPQYPEQALLQPLWASHKSSSSYPEFPSAMLPFRLLQLPHIGDEEVKAISSAKPPIKGIAQYIKLKKEDRMVGELDLVCCASHRRVVNPSNTDHRLFLF